MIPVSEPSLLGNEQRYVAEALEEGWISSTGRFVDRFESDFARWLGTDYAVSTSSGTTALHLALLCLGVGPGDEVIVPSLSFVATHNAVLYCGATPIFVDVDPKTWGVSAETISHAYSSRTKAIVVVHLYGVPVDMDEVLNFAKTNGLFVVEDAAEALGGVYKGRPCGTMADVSCFSLYGNKVMTTGEGGLLVTNNREIADQAKLLRGQGQDPHRRYFHIELGYNYRLTNVQSAIGCAQLEQVDDFLSKRSKVFARYQEALAQSAHSLEFPLPLVGSVQAPWLFTILLPANLESFRDQTIVQLRSLGVETRPTFEVAHRMPPYVSMKRCPDQHVVAERISRSGISLPTYFAISESQQFEVVEALEQVLTAQLS